MNPLRAIQVSPPAVSGKPFPLSAARALVDSLQFDHSKQMEWNRKFANIRTRGAAITYLGVIAIDYPEKHREIEKILERYLEREKGKVLRGHIADVMLLISYTHLGELLGHEGIIRLIALARSRRFFPKSALDRLIDKLIFLKDHDRDSFLFINRIASRFNDPDSPKLGRLLTVVHKTALRIRVWPPAFRRKGPIAAVYYHLGPNSKEVRRFGKLLLNPRIMEIEVNPDSGRYVASIRPEAKPFDPSHQVFGSSEVRRISDSSDRQILSDLVQFLKTEKLLFTVAGLSVLFDKIRLIAERDVVSFRSLLDHLRKSRRQEGQWNRREWHRIRKAIHSTAYFIGRWAGVVKWSGSLFDFFYRNMSDKYRRQIFHNRVSYGHVKQIKFEGAKAIFG